MSKCSQTIILKKKCNLPNSKNSLKSTIIKMMDSMISQLILIGIINNTKFNNRGSSNNNSNNNNISCNSNNIHNNSNNRNSIIPSTIKSKSKTKHMIKINSNFTLKTRIHSYLLKNNNNNNYNIEKW